jgi:large subunit ribosomal protein L25
MSNVVFAAKKRTASGKASVKALRRAGRIPAVLYGRTGGSTAIDVDVKEFLTGVKGISESTIVTVDVEGTAHSAFVKDTQRDIVHGDVLHVDFYAVESGRVLRTRVPVRVHGNPVGVREGGILELPLHSIEVECLPKDLPERIEVDIAGLQVNQSIHVRDLPLGADVKLISPADQVVALVKFAKVEKVEAAPTAEAAAAETAAGAPAETKAGAPDAKAAEEKKA